MIGLLTWTTYGTWLAGPARGNVARPPSDDGGLIPEPDLEASAARRRSLKWSPAQLDASQGRVILEDLHRIAGIRDFTVHVAVVCADHVHLLISIDQRRDIPRLVQLIKGALSRRLTVDAGDRPASSGTGEQLPYHKWWNRQYAFSSIADFVTMSSARQQLLDHNKRGTVVWDSGLSSTEAD